MTLNVAMFIASGSLWMVDTKGQVRKVPSSLSFGESSFFAPAADFTAFNGKVYFSSLSSQQPNFISYGNYSLYVTDGTSGGPSEFTGVNGANVSGIYKGVGGLDPTDLTVFNGEMLFDGLDSSNHHNLWVTNGTVAGTSEITGIMGAAAEFAPNNLTVF